MTDDCTCGPCCRCGYDGDDSDGADCFGQKPSVEKAGLPGVRFLDGHCSCWTISGIVCPLHGLPDDEVAEVMEGLEVCAIAGVPLPKLAKVGERDV